MTQKDKELERELDNFLINWKLVAEPQAEQYDSQIVLKFAHQNQLFHKSLGEHPTFFNGQVNLCHSATSSLPSHCIPAPFDHPNLKKACELIHLWPTVFAQFQLLTDSVYPYTNNQHSSKVSYSSSCDGGGFGQIAATVDDPVALAECLVHEMAHHKLRALGVELESAKRIIKNLPEQKFPSPIRYDCLRPMPAVFHAQYSFTYVAALDIEIISSSKEIEIIHRCTNALAQYLPKLEFGGKIIRDNAAVDRVGADFLACIIHE